MSKIQSPELFKAVYHATQRTLQRGVTPSQLVFPGTRLTRAFDLRYANLLSGVFTQSAAAANVTVRDGASDGNRFSGVSAEAGIRAQGAVYTSRHHAAMLNEILHYARKDNSMTFDPSSGFPSFGLALISRCVIEMTTTKPLLIADLSPYSDSTAPFLKDLERDAEVAAALKTSTHRGRSLRELLAHDSDYTVGRAIGLAIGNSRDMQGLEAPTARPSDRVGETGTNVVLYGPNNLPISCVQVERATIFGWDGAGGLQIVDYPVGDVPRERGAALSTSEAT